MATNYLTMDIVHSLFEVIYQNFSRVETVPFYADSHDGMDKLQAVLDGVRMDNRYPTVFEKSTYLFIQINKGHFFPNGNKRLALVCAVIFLYMNGFYFNHTKEQYEDLLGRAYPNYVDSVDYADFTPEDYLLYNLSVIVADSHKCVTTFDELKSSVQNILEKTLVPMK